MSTTHYEVIERIAVGGMAEIYLGVARGLEGFSRPVVIKKVRPRLSNDERFVQMLIKEAKITAALSHPNIVQILDLGRNTEGEHFIVMEYVDGQDLRSLIDEATAKGVELGASLAVFIAAEVCSALDHAHRQVDDSGRPLSLIHRDVSPSNVLVSLAGEVKLTDFGIARYGRDVSVIGTLKGKLAYMSPEQGRGKTVDHRSDLYSLGAILFEIVLGRRVHQAETDLEMLERVRDGQVPLPSSIRPEIPLELERVLLRALSPSPAQRFQSAEEMGNALRALLFRTAQPAGAKELAALIRELFPLRRSTKAGAGPRFLVTGSIAGFQSIVEDAEPLQVEHTAVSAPPEHLLRQLRSVEGHGTSERTPVVELPPPGRPDRGGPLRELPTDRAVFGGGSEEEVMRIITSIPSLDDLDPIVDEEAEPSPAAPRSESEVTAVASPIREVASSDLVELEPTGVEGAARGLGRAALRRVDTEEQELVPEPARPEPAPARREPAVPVREPARVVAAPPAREPAPPPAAPQPPADPTGPVTLPAPRARVATPAAARPTTTGPLRPPEEVFEPPTAPLPPLHARPPGREPAQRPRRLLPILAVSLLGLGLGSTAAWVYLRTGRVPRTAGARPDLARSGPDRGRAAAVADAGARRDGSRPAAADRGVHAVAAADARRTHVVLKPGPKPVRPPRPAPRPTGQLVIKSEPWAYIHVDGRNTRKITSATPFPLPAGTHRIELVNPELKLRTGFTVTIAAGETVRRFVRLEKP